jgi:hypothetical protein
LSTLDDMPAQRSWSTRNWSGPSRSSQITRSAQRRPSRSSSAMIGRPVREPRTLRFFMAEAGFGMEAPLQRYGICSNLLLIL